MKRLFTYLITITAVCVFSGATSVDAGVTGTISGRVTDANSKAALVGVSVGVDGTELGAVTDAEGYFTILQVPPGEYALTFSSVGFSNAKVTGVIVSADQSRKVNMGLTASVTELKDAITVTAQKDIVEPGKTASLTRVRAEDIAKLPTRGYQQLLSLQTGVVTVRPPNPSSGRRGTREATTAPELNVRGGRPNSVGYFVDGFSQQDPLSGLATTNINNNAIEEVSLITGGFDAEYGLITSGVVNTISKSGGPKLSGGVEIISDALLGSKGYDQNTYAADVSGPLGNTKSGTFYLSGERTWKGDRNPSPVTQEFIPKSLTRDSDGDGRMLPYNWESAWTGQGKLTFKLTDAVKAQVSGNYSQNDWREYRQSMLFNSSHSSAYKDRNWSVNGKLSGTANPKTFYNAALGVFRTERERGDGVFFDSLALYTTDARDETELYYLPGATAVQGGYLHRISSRVQGSADITRQISRSNSLKAGVDFQRHTLRLYNHIVPYQYASNPNNPVAKFQDLNRYGFDTVGNVSDESGSRNEVKHPVNISAFLQDHYDWTGLVVNAGLRLDYFDYKTDKLVNPDNPLAGGASVSTLDPEDLTPANSYQRVSPRLGVAFPIDERTNMHISYGKFYQMPELDKLFVGYDFFEYKLRNGGYYFATANPNLKPEKTTAYELGLTRQMGRYVAMEVTAFYKDIQDLIQVQTQPATPRSFQIYQNSDFGTVKGLELHLKTARQRSTQIDLKYTLSYANGTGSYAQTNRNAAWTSDISPRQVSPLDYDRRHVFTGIFDLRAGKDEGPRMGESRPLQNAGISAVVSFSSGGPYSRSVIYNEVTTAASAALIQGGLNASTGPSIFTIDIKADKAFKFSDYSATLYVQVLNLLDRKNPVYVYEGTGDPSTTGYLTTAEGQNTYTDDPNADIPGYTRRELYELRERDPLNFANPRMVQFGLRVNY